MIWITKNAINVLITKKKLAEGYSENLAVIQLIGFAVQALVRKSIKRSEKFGYW